MGKREYDVVVIGAGPGGYVAAIRAAQLGLKTACIEKGKTLGGTCLNVGCIPSKSLLQATEYYHFLQQKGKEFGIECDHLNMNFNQMMIRKNQVVKGLTDGIVGLFKESQVVRIEGDAHFISPNELEVTNDNQKQVIEAEYFILATGSESIALPFLPFDEKTIVSSTGALSLEKVPSKLCVIGAGVIGVELASVYRRLGAEVTIVEMLDRICPAMDQAISKSLLQILKKQGLVFHLGATVTAAKQENGKCDLTVKQGDTQISKEADVVLVAVGRRPYSQGLGLSEIGVKTTPKGFVSIDSRFHTSVPNIFAIGDLIEGVMLAHRASAEGVAVAEIIAGQNPSINYMAIPNVIYTNPEVAAVGMTEDEAKELGWELKIGVSYFRANPRARCSGETDGFVKLIAEKKSDRLIGMHIIGSHASEMIGEGVVALEKGVTMTQLANFSHPHPTLSETIKEAAQEGERQR